MSKNTARSKTEIFGNDAELIIEFEYEPADPDVGWSDEITIERVLLRRQEPLRWSETGGWITPHTKPMDLDITKWMPGHAWEDCMDAARQHLEAKSEEEEPNFADAA